MATLREHYVRYEEEWRQAERQDVTHEAHENADFKNTYTRHAVIVLDFLTEYFPVVNSFTPQASEHENRIEYAPLIDFLKILSNKHWILERYIKKPKENPQPRTHL